MQFHTDNEKPQEEKNQKNHIILLFVKKKTEFMMKIMEEKINFSQNLYMCLWYNIVWLA